MNKHFETQEEYETWLAQDVKDRGLIEPELIFIKGKDGVDGTDGYNGQDGKDGKTPTKQDLLLIIEPLIPKPIPAIDGKDGTNGKDGSPDTGEEIVNKINDLSNEAPKIDAKHIKNLPKPITNHYSQSNISLNGLSNKGILYNKNGTTSVFGSYDFTKDVVYVGQLQKTKSVTINRTGNQITSLSYAGGYTKNLNYTSGVLSSISDETITKTINRSGSTITGVTVS